jgi:hypothetical protein
MMLGWFRKKDSSDPFELGRRVAQSANADLEAYVQARFYPGILNMADVIFGDFENPNVPPLVLARADLKNFVERLDGHLRPSVMPELRSAMAGWINMDVGVSSEIERLIEHHFNQFKSNIALAGLQRFLDMTDFLKEADDKWRATNPDKAAQFPFDTLGPELGDVLAPYLKVGNTKARR